MASYPVWASYPTLPYLEVLSVYSAIYYKFVGKLLLELYWQSLSTQFQFPCCNYLRFVSQIVISVKHFQNWELNYTFIPGSRSVITLLLLNTNLLECAASIVFTLNLWNLKTVHKVWRKSVIRWKLTKIHIPAMPFATVNLNNLAFSE